MTSTWILLAVIREDHDHGKGDGLYAHYIGYYKFLDEVHKKYPGVVIEIVHREV